MGFCWHLKPPALCFVGLTYQQEKAKDSVRTDHVPGVYSGCKRLIGVKTAAGVFDDVCKSVLAELKAE